MRTPQKKKTAATKMPKPLGGKLVIGKKPTGEVEPADLFNGYGTEFMGAPGGAEGPLSDSLTPRLGFEGYSSFSPKFTPTGMTMRSQMMDRIPVESFTGQNWLKTKLGEGLAARGDDSAEDAAARIRQYSKTATGVDSLGPLSVETATEIWRGFVDTMAPSEPVTKSFSPEVAAMMEKAYGGDVPRRNMASFDDIPNNEKLFLAALVTGGLLRGKPLSIEQIGKLSGGMVDQAQQQIDSNYQQDMLVDQRRRQFAATALERLIDVEDFNAEQRGAEARDTRVAARGLAANVITGMQQAWNQLNANERMMGLEILRQIPSVDPARAKELVTSFETLTGKKLGIDATSFDATIKQQKDLADIEATHVRSEYLAALTDGVDIRNERDLKTMESVVAKINLEDEIARANLEKIIETTKMIPKDYQLRYKIGMAKIEAMRTQANAALERARKAGKEGFDALKVASLLSRQREGFNTTIDNKRSQITGIFDQIAKYQRELDKENLLYPGKNPDRVKDLQGAITKLNEQLKAVEDGIDKDSKDLDTVNTKLKGLMP